MLYRDLFYSNESIFIFSTEDFFVWTIESCKNEIFVDSSNLFFSLLTNFIFIY